MKFAGVMALLVLLAGCVAQGEKEERTFVTGSNLPQRDRAASGVVTVKPEEFEKSRQSGTAQSAPKTGG